MLPTHRPFLSNHPRAITPTARVRNHSLPSHTSHPHQLSTLPPTHLTSPLRPLLTVIGWLARSLSVRLLWYLLSGSLFYFFYLLLLYFASESTTAISPLPTIWSDGCVAVQCVLLTAVALFIAVRQQPDRQLVTVASTQRVVLSLAPLASVWLLCLYTLLLAAWGAVPLSSMSPPAPFPLSPLDFSAVSVLGYAALLFLPASLCFALLFHDHSDGETHLHVASFLSLLCGALLAVPILVLLHYQWGLPYTTLVAINPIPTLYSLALLCLLPCLLMYHRHYHSVQPYSPLLDGSVNGWGEDGLGNGVNGANGGGKYGKAGAAKGKGWMSRQYQALLAGSELSVDSEDDEEHVAIF